MAWTPEYGRLYRARNKEKIFAGIRSWKKQNREKVNASARKTYARNTDGVERKRQQNAAWWKNLRKNSPEVARVKDATRQIREKSKRDAERARIAGRPRPDVCDICKQNNRWICFDHCHASGRFRGWICDRCNKVLGLVEDDPALLRALAEYLERSDASPPDGET